MTADEAIRIVKLPYQSQYSEDEIEEALVAGIERLRAIVERLPKTADGVCIAAATDLVWLNRDNTISKVTGWYVYDDGIWGVRTSDSVTFVVAGGENRCYSTLEAALAAGGKHG